MNLELEDQIKICGFGIPEIILQNCLSINNKIINIGNLEPIITDIISHGCYIYKAIVNKKYKACIKMPIYGDIHEYKNTYENILDEVVIYSFINNMCPNIPKFYGMWGNNLVIEWISGLTLEKIIDCPMEIKKDDIFNFVKDICMALNWLHTHGISHNDIKPSNVIFSSDSNKWILVDFGLSTRFGFKAASTLGTDGYISHRTGNTFIVSSKNDIFSFGIVLKEFINCYNSCDKHTNKIDDKIIQLSNKCVDKDSSQIPEFHEILKLL